MLVENSADSPQRDTRECRSSATESESLEVTLGRNPERDGLQADPGSLATPTGKLPVVMLELGPALADGENLLEARVLGKPENGRKSPVRFTLEDTEKEGISQDLRDSFHPVNTDVEE